MVAESASGGRVSAIENRWIDHKWPEWARSRHKRRELETSNTLSSPNRVGGKNAVAE